MGEALSVELEIAWRDPKEIPDLPHAMVSPTLEPTCQATRLAMDGVRAMLPDDLKGVFGPDTLRLLGKAHRSACNTIRRTRPLTAEDEQTIASRVMAQAHDGEKNLRRLVRNALDGLLTRH
jgi:hypothetical protein